MKTIFIFLCGLFLSSFWVVGCEGDHAPAIQSTAQETAGVEYLNAEEQKFLLKLARLTLENFLENKPLPEIDLASISPILKEERGCFVTLNKDHRLRGCIGYLQPRQALVTAVMENATNAAVRDHRFTPVTRAELNSLSIEISVLTVPRLLSYKNTQQLLAKLVPERDGLIIKSSRHQSTYLPQVWKQIPEKKEFLSRLCLKGGAESGCWKDPKTEIYIYQAQVFSEEKIK